MFVKYSQKYSLFIYFFNSTEVRTEALEICCVMIPLLVDTWPDFALFRVVRPYAYQTDFEIRPLACKKVTTVKIGL